MHRLSFVALAAIIVALAFPIQARGMNTRTVRADTVNWKAVDAAMGRAGTMQPGDVYKYGLPRSDLTVHVGDVTLKPALALGGWVAFRASGNRAMAMGDIVLLESEIGPVMAALQSAGVQQTAVHNHLLNETPRIMYMHIEADGDPVVIARAIRAALALTRLPAPLPAGTPPSIGFDTAAFARRLGYHGKANGGVYQVGVARQDMVHADGMEVPPSMGVATSINVQAATAGKVAATGDFVLAASEVNPVIKMLREHGITVTALHSHMLTEEPRLLFMHFWANDDAGKVADGLHAALAVMKVKAP
ncbi:MAG TPA: DUF1259 domain-containing protein [Gemmatimonadales bacterium]